MLRKRRLDRRSESLAPQVASRKYEVRGTDRLDDVHASRTDHRERAEEMLALMREDAEDVELVEHTSG